MIDLASKPMTEVRDYARAIGVTPKQHESRDALLSRIALVAFSDNQKPAEQAKPVVNPVTWSTQDEVNEAVAEHIRKGMRVSYDEQARTWHFSYAGAEDSGSLSVPLHVIKQKATQVARGALKPRVLGSAAGDLAGALV